MTTLTRLYDRLTPEERFLAFASALSRRDMQEADRLNDTCPQKAYRIDEPAYTQAKIELHRMAMTHRLTMERLDTALLSALIMVLVEKETEEQDEDCETHYDLFCRTLELRAAKAAAWSGFCRAAFGAEPEELETSLSTQANPLVDPLLEMLLKHGAVEPPELADSAIAEQREALDSYWNSRRERW